MFGASVGNIFKAHDKPFDVREGAFYRHSGPGELTETAEVLHVGPDAMGITHVHFRVMVESACETRTNFEESRTLNIESFTDFFSETIQEEETSVEEPE